MKIVEQSHEILFDNCTLSNTQKIEIAARTCYKSEGVIKPGSDIDLCTKLIKRGHEAMLEHGYIIVEVHLSLYSILRNLPSKITTYFEFSSLGNTYLVSANIRAWRDLIKIYPKMICLSDLWGVLNAEEPTLFKDIPCIKNTMLMEVKNSLLPRVVNESNLKPGELAIHKKYSVRFITDRGVSHELVRHRTASFAQESTRYVNYKDKGMEFIKPVFDWADCDIEEEIHVNNKLSLIDYTVLCSWYSTCCQAEEIYCAMLRVGKSPQEARSVLPTSLKTEIIVTGTLKVWESIFKLRCANGAHPQIRKLLEPVQNVFV